MSAEQPLREMAGIRLGCKAAARPTGDRTSCGGTRRCCFSAPAITWLALAFAWIHRRRLGGQHESRRRCFRRAELLDASVASRLLCHSVNAIVGSAETQTSELSPFRSRGVGGTRSESDRAVKPAVAAPSEHQPSRGRASGGRNSGVAGTRQAMARRAGRGCSARDAATRPARRIVAGVVRKQSPTALSRASSSWLLP
jgi:hypothetical protein